MQRLSLSSSSLKEDIDNNVEEPKLRVSLSSASILAADNDDDTAGKIRRSSLPPSRSGSFFIHLLPLLIFLCFLILYLFSHPPSDSEMAHFHTFNRLSKFSDSGEDLNNIGGIPADTADIFPIRAVKNMQETRTHRKFANF